MLRNPRPAAEEMLVRIIRLRRYVGVDLSAFDPHSDDRAIVERDLEVLSEASRSFPLEFKDARPDIDWRGIADIGNILRHAYDRLSVPRLQAVINERLDDLQTVVETYLSGKTGPQARQARKNE